MFINALACTLIVITNTTIATDLVFRS